MNTSFCEGFLTTCKTPSVGIIRTRSKGYILSHKQCVHKPVYVYTLFIGHPCFYVRIIIALQRFFVNKSCKKYTNPSAVQNCRRADRSYLLLCSFACLITSPQPIGRISTASIRLSRVHSCVFVATVKPQPESLVHSWKGF